MNLYKKLFIFLSIAVITLLACSSGWDTTQECELYLPSFYSPEKKWPVIYFFDSHGRGALPVSKYKSLAEKYGYVLVGSNMSKNGLDLETSANIVKKLRDKIEQKVSVDKNRECLAGFSGGSRVASWVAIHSGANSVIACAAGFPKLNKPIEKHFNYLGVVGNEDFNLGEMKNLDLALNGSEIAHELIIYRGKHDWPPAEIMEEAFLWLGINFMKEKLLPINDTLLMQTMKIFEKNIKKETEHGKIYESYNLYNRLIHYGDGLFDISDFRNKSAEISKSAEWKEILRMEKEIEIWETGKQKEYIEALSSKSIDWWEKEVYTLQLKSNTGEDEMAMNSRLLGFLSIVLYMNSSAALNKEGDEAEHFLKLYRLVDPENTDAFYLSACFSAKQNDNREAINYLKHAVRLGFKDIDKIKQDPFFEPIKGTQEFKEFVKSL